MLSVLCSGSDAIFWVAAKEVKLSYDKQETLECVLYTNSGNLIYNP